MMAPSLIPLLAACGQGSGIICVGTPSEGCAVAPLQPAVPETVTRAGPGGSLFVRVFEEALASPTPPTTTWGELTGRAAWRWWRWAPADDGASWVEALPPSTADVLWFQVDGRVYGTETTEDDSTTTLIDIGAESGPDSLLTVPGFLHGVSRIRSVRV